MQNLPTAEVYNKEVKYMPWGILISEIEALVSAQAPQRAGLVDLLCGTGNLLGRLKKLRSDIDYHGVDLEQEYIDFATAQQPDIAFEVADVLTWSANRQYDVVLATGGLHHIAHESQEAFIQKVSTLINPGGFAVIGDPYIGDYTNEREREIAGAKLGYEYLVATIENGADREVTEAAIGVLSNDVLLVEFKTSISKIRPIFEKYFDSVEMHKTWPKESTDYGDYYFVLRK